MHEMGIAMQIMDIVRQSLPPGEPVKVRAIHLRLGKLTAIVPASLKFCMEVVTRDTPAEGAELRFTEVPVVVVCGECYEESEITEPPFACAKCGSGKVKVLSGREMMVDAIEVEDLPR